MDPFFIYLLKCGGILFVFFAVYKLLLQQETFFNGNRYFLLAGIAGSLLLPLLVFTKTVYTEPSPLTAYGSAVTGAANSLSAFSTTDWTVVFPIIYWTGVMVLSGRFVIQLLSLLRLIRSGTIVKDGKFTMVETRADVTPFSFFTYIVYYPGSHSENARNAIIAHEKIHAYQWHSADILLAHLLTVFLWFVPFAWSYKRCITQNLEYTADNEAVQKLTCRKNYQYLLLNASTKAYQPAITNNFFNSLIKKRIVMLNKNRSQQSRMWRYGVILPLLTVFLLTFNVKTVAQVKVKEKEDNMKVVEIVRFTIDKNTTNDGLDKLRAKIKNDDGKFSYKDLKRNAKGEITAITIEFRDDKGRFVTGNYDDDDGIAPIVFGKNEKGGLFITSGDPHSEGYSGHGIHIREHAGHDMDTEADVIIIDRSGKGEKKKVRTIKKTVEGDIDVEEYLDGDNVVIVERPGKDEKKKIHKIKVESRGSKGGGVVFSGDDGDPLVFIDGKESTKKQAEAMESETIERIEILKGEDAIEKYGKKARDGVILITTHKKED